MGTVLIGVLAAASLYGGVHGTLAVVKGAAAAAAFVSPPVAVAVGAIILYKVLY